MGTGKNHVSPFLSKQFPLKRKANDGFQELFSEKEVNLISKKLTWLIASVTAMLYHNTSHLGSTYRALSTEATALCSGAAQVSSTHRGEHENS